MMSTRRLLGLPIEIKHCILSHLPSRRLPNLPPRNFSRFNSSTSYSVLPRVTTSLDRTPTTLVSSFEHEEAIFESPSSKEYDQVPPSTLDNPTASPRSPTDSLLSLLRVGEYKDAIKLLEELEKSGQKGSIELNYEFGKFAFQGLIKRESRTGVNEEGTRLEWLRWWELTPSSSERGRTFSKKRDREQFQLASRISKELNRLLEEEYLWETVEGKGVVDEMRLFGQSLARKGQARNVAEEIIGSIALKGRDVGTAIELWEFTLEELRRQIGEPTTRVDDGFSRWWRSKNLEAYKVLVRSRETIIRALTNQGRVDESIDILLSTREYPSLLSPSTPISPSKRLYIVIFAQLATQDRFDLFERVYREFERAGNKLVRIKDEKLRIWSPYSARGKNYETPVEGTPSAQEAFTTFRDQHAVSSIEEGSFESQPTRTPQKEEEEAFDTTEYSRILGEDYQHYGRTTSQAESQNLIKLVESERLDLALNKLESLLSRGPLPSAQSVATFINRVEDHPNGQDVFVMIDERVKGSHWRRGFWATSRMLGDLHKGEQKLVVRRFRDYFNLNGLPFPLIKALNGATPRIPSTRRIERDEVGGESTSRDTQIRLLPRSTTNAYTLSILMQALVPILSESHSGGSQHLSRIYSSLLDPHSFEIIPSHKPYPLNSLSTPRSSPLDPYTFIPFLLLTLSRHESTPQTRSSNASNELLEILVSMQHLGIPPQLPHLSLLLSSYARSSPDLNDFHYLLSCIEEQTSSIGGIEEGLVEPKLVEFVKRQFPRRSSSSSSPESTTNTLSPKLYATLLKALRLRSAREGGSRKGRVGKESMLVLQRLMEKLGGPEGIREMLESEEGEGMKREVGLLGTGRKEEV